jgi:hypothetical protein
MDIVKGDVFKDKDGKEYVFVGWWTDPLFGRMATGVLYRTARYDGVQSISEEDMVKHEHWIGGFMTNEGT